MDIEEGVEEEDLLTIEGGAQQMIEMESTNEPAQQLDERHELFYTDSQIGQRRLITPHIQLYSG